ncbi:MAG TPA: hypothetical protein VLK35_00910 [Methylomirabilota bacterium]|nr:hypothetical protein [Methylomirabilota bacterium]
MIGQGVVTAGLGVLLLAAGGAWDEAEADRGRRGGHHHRGHHHGGHHGFHGKHFYGHSSFFGPRFYGPRWYPYYAYPRPFYGGYYYGYAPVVTPPPVVVTPPPTPYVERPSSQYWHYCHDPAGYYPEVQQCPGGWIQVPPRSD